MTKEKLENIKDKDDELKELKINKIVTSLDVAKLAGVSQTSVSRVFNSTSSREVKQETREKVMAAAKELGYKPNIIARSMISKKTDIIGIVIGNPVGPFYTKIITRLTEKIQEQGKQCLMFTVDAGEDINVILERVLQYQVDGIIITAAALSREMANLCIQNDTPVVLFNRFVPGLNASSVYCDNIEAGRLVAQYLAENGHKNIAHITYEKDTPTVMERKIGFYGMLRECGIYNIMEENADYTYESGYNATLRLLKQGNIPDAIFCSSDLIAMGSIDAVRFETGLKVPEDISIVGFDDIPMAQWAAYNLTTVHQPVELLVDETIRVLSQLITDPTLGPISEVLKMKIIKRKSTREK